MGSITIRGLDNEISEKIKEKARSENKSMNQWVLDILRQNTGLDKKKIMNEYHDLDHLMGTWSEKEYNEFKQNTSEFSKVDSKLWDKHE